MIGYRMDNPPEMTKTTEALLAYSQEWDNAIAANDVQRIGEYMADDWVCVGTEGGITLKADFLRHIASGDLVHTRMDTDESRVKIYGDTGIVTAKGTSAGFYKGNPFSFYEWSTSIFTRDGDGWQCVLTMLTPAR